MNNTNVKFYKFKLLDINMKKGFIIGIIVVVLIVVFVALSPEARKAITGFITGEHNFAIYSSKSGLMSSLDNEISFNSVSTEVDSYYLGGGKDYRHYEYFSLVGIPSKARIISAQLTLYRVSQSEDIQVSVKRVSELWEEHQTYETKGRYPLVYPEEVIASGNRYVVFDVSEMVQQMILPSEQAGGNFGFEISSQDKPRDFYLRNTAAEFRPILYIIYRTRIKAS